jgi:hypothetical protein
MIQPSRGAAASPSPEIMNPAPPFPSRSTAGSLAVFALLAVGLALRARGADAPKFTDVAMLESSGLPAVALAAKGALHLTFLVDTGNTNSIIDLAKAKELGLPVRPLMGPDGKPYEHYFKSKLLDVQVGNISLGDVVVLVLDLQTDMAKGSVPKADGVLAYTALKDRVLRMDYVHRRVGISGTLENAVTAPEQAVPLTNPTFGKEGPPIVASTGFQLNGQPLTVQIDTLYSGTLLIYPTSVEKLGLAGEAASKKVRMFHFTDGGVNMMEGVSTTEGFGGRILATGAPVYFATKEVHLPDGMFDGTVGDELFEGHVLTFDFHDHLFWID